MEQELIKAIIKERINYDPQTGQLTWKERDTSLACHKWFNENKAGKLCGNITVSKKDGYAHHRVIMECSGERLHISAARTAWLLMTGDWPNHTIDHINRNSTDQRWENLRDVPQGINNHNKNHYVCNKIGLKGVNLHNGKYWARFSSKGITYRLGHFDTPEEAAKAYDAKAYEILGDESKLNFVRLDLS
jgi:hypothetical protein